MFLVSAERKRALVWALVAAVAVASLVVFVGRRRGLKIGTGQIIEQDFETGAEQILPALAQMIEQRRLVLQKLVEAAVEAILLHQRIIGPQQIRHRALLEPQPMQAPLATGIDQPITDQRLQDAPPLRPFARIRQTRRPEPIEFQLLIQLTRQPARAPLPQPVQLHCIEPHLHAVTIRAFRNLAIGAKHPPPALPLAAFLQASPPPRPTPPLPHPCLPPLHHPPPAHPPPRP